VGGSFLDKNESVKIKRKKRMSYNDQGKVVYDDQGEVVYRDYSICLKSSNVKPICPDFKPEYKQGTAQSGVKSDVNVGYLNGSSLQSLGWIKDISKTVNESGKNNDIEITRQDIGRGYSDIPLAMMMDYCFNKLKVSIFDSIPPEHLYSGYEGLGDIGRDMLDAVSRVENGNRYWLIPDDDCYKSLRLKYLHFSADDNPVGHLVPTVNTPGYNGDNVMCRITYHGDKGEEQKSAADGVHFLYDLFGIIKSISR